MKKTYSGRCHCGAVQFECELDLSAGTYRCNCSFCRRARFWMALAKSAEFRLLRGAADLVDYQHTSPGRPEPFLHLTFCRHCGIRGFTKGGFLPSLGGEFYAVNLGCLDGVSDAELAAAPVHFTNGRDDDFTGVTDATRYL